MSRALIGAASLAACGGGQVGVAPTRRAPPTTRARPRRPSRRRRPSPSSASRHSDGTDAAPAPRTTTTEGSNALPAEPARRRPQRRHQGRVRHAVGSGHADPPQRRQRVRRRFGRALHARQHSYDCTGTGDGATCTPIAGDATQSDIDAYTGLVADALGHTDVARRPHDVSILGRTAECVSIVGRPDRDAPARRSSVHRRRHRRAAPLHHARRARSRGRSSTRCRSARRPIADFQLPVPPSDHAPAAPSARQ